MQRHRQTPATAVWRLARHGWLAPALYEENRNLGIGDFITFEVVAHAFARLWHETLRATKKKLRAPYWWEEQERNVA